MAYLARDREFESRVASLGVLVLKMKMNFISSMQWIDSSQLWYNLTAHHSIYENQAVTLYTTDSLAGQPLHKRGRVWSTSHHEFVLQSQQWASSTRCE